MISKTLFVAKGLTTKFVRRRLSSFRIPKHIASSYRNVARDCVSQIYVFIATKWRSKVTQEGGWPSALFGYLIHGQERGLLRARGRLINPLQSCLSLYLFMYLSLCLTGYDDADMTRAGIAVLICSVIVQGGPRFRE